MSLEAYSKTVVKRTLAILFLQIGIVLDVPRRVRELYQRGSTTSKICHPQPGLNLGRHHPSYSLRTPFRWPAWHLRKDRTSSINVLVAAASLLSPPPSLLLRLKTPPCCNRPLLFPSRVNLPWKHGLKLLSSVGGIIPKGNAHLSPTRQAPYSDFFFLIESGQHSSASVSNLEFSVSGGVSLLYRNKPV